MPVSNAQLAAVFQQMADLGELLGRDRFRVNAFARAARCLRELAEDVAAVGPDIAKLCEFDGIGKGMAERIAELLTTGKMQEYDDLRAQVPDGVLPMLNIPGLGPKTVALLWKQAGVESVEALRQRIEADPDSLTKLPGIGKKKLEKIAESLKFAQQSQGRVRLGRALPLAAWFVEQLEENKHVQRAAFAGSLRRGRDTIGDIDLIVAADPSNAPAITEAFVNLPGVASVIASGATKTSIRTADNLQVDLRIVEPASYGAALLYFTGSKEHNVRLRERAIKRGQKLSEYGLFEGDNRVAGETEEAVYRALGLDWVPPEMREDHGELSRAEQGTLPQLVELENIKAELHAHTTASDGVWEIDYWAEAAIGRGFHTCAVTDHSVSQHIANGLSAERLAQHILDIRAAAKRFDGRIRILVGSEVDILADGRLDYPDELLAELDIVVASPHLALTQEPAAATKRLLRAIENPHVTILGHPTGRIVGRRPGLDPDMGQVIKAAKERGIALEINANHNRLDLRDTHARAAVEAGVKLAINTDAHGPADLDELRYGILTARRAGATAEDVVNTYDAEKLATWIESTRAS